MVFICILYVNCFSGVLLFEIFRIVNVICGVVNVFLVIYINSFFIILFLFIFLFKLYVRYDLVVKNVLILFRFSVLESLSVSLCVVLLILKVIFV